jgi:hypothetical protein
MYDQGPIFHRCPTKFGTEGQMLLISTIHKITIVLTSGVPWKVWGALTPPHPRNSEVLTKLIRIPSSVENTSVKT